jgi:hypothetical protein
MTGSHDNSVSIATRQRARQPRSRSSIPGMGKRFFSSPWLADRLWGIPSLLYNRTGGCFPGVKRQGREADHSPLSSAEVKNCGAIHPFLIRLYGVVLN